MWMSIVYALTQTLELDHCLHSQCAVDIEVIVQVSAGVVLVTVVAVGYYVMCSVDAVDVVVDVVADVVDVVADAVAGAVVVTSCVVEFVVKICLKKTQNIRKHRSTGIGAPAD